MAIRYLIPDGKHLPVTGEDGKPDHHLMGAAWAALHSGYRGNKYEGPGKEKALAALTALYKSEGMETPRDEADHLDSEARGGGMRLSLVRDGLVRVPLCYTNAPGTVFDQAGAKFKFDDSDLEEFRKNLAVREVPIDYDHLSTSADVRPPGWAKAAGWLARPDDITAFTEGRKLLWGWARYTPTMLAMVKDQEYRYCSIDFDFSGKDETGHSVGAKIKALAMTNRPFLRDLPPIEISNEDYQQLMGMAARTDGKLAALTLSEGGARLLNPEAVHVPAAITSISVGYGQPRSQESEVTSQNSSSASADKGGKTMAGKLCLKCSADGKHEVYDGDGDDANKLGEVEEKHLKQYAKTHLAMAPAADADGGQTSEKLTADARAALLSEIGAEGKAAAEIKQLIEKGIAASAAPEKTEAQLLCDSVDDNGGLKLSEIDKLMDEGKIKPSAYRRAAAAEADVTKAFTQGRIKPTDRKKALQLCLADRPAFDAFIVGGKPLVDTTRHSVNGPKEEGDKVATTQFKALVSQKMTELKLSEDQAKTVVVSTKEGAALWEAMRLEEIEETKGK